MLARLAKVAGAFTKLGTSLSELETCAHRCKRADKHNVSAFNKILLAFSNRHTAQPLSRGDSCSLDVEGHKRYACARMCHK